MITTRRRGSLTAQEIFTALILLSLVVFLIAPLPWHLGAAHGATYGANQERLLWLDHLYSKGWIVYDSNANPYLTDVTPDEIRDLFTTVIRKKYE
jgi:hypothetical protein